MTIKTVAPCHSRCGTLKNPHCSSMSKICSPSPVKMTYSFESKILELDENKQTNKQTNIIVFLIRSNQSSNVFLATCVNSWIIGSRWGQMFWHAKVQWSTVKKLFTPWMHPNKMEIEDRNQPGGNVLSLISTSCKLITKDAFIRYVCMG